MKFELMTDHFAADRILPAGTIVDFDDPTFGYKTRRGYAAPSASMRPLDDDARAAFVERHPHLEDSSILDPVGQIPISTPYANVMKSSAPGDTTRPGSLDGGGRLVTSKKITEEHGAEELATVDVGEPLGRMNADQVTLPGVANVETDVIKAKVREAEIKDEISKQVEGERQEALDKADAEFEKSKPASTKVADPKPVTSNNPNRTVSPADGKGPATIPTNFGDKK